MTHETRACHDARRGHRGAGALDGFHVDAAVALLFAMEEDAAKQPGHLARRRSRLVLSAAPTASAG